jgi:homocysteine S-methyltransferase
MELLLLDGALGTELARRGWDVTDSLWSARVLLDHPEAVEQVHLDYLSAGARCITTGSYQISFEGFEQVGFSRHEAAKALMQSVEIAKRARARFLEKLPPASLPIIAASVGPYGASLADGSEFHGNYNCSYAELLAFHAQRLFCLAKAEPDLFACETIPSWQEAEALLESLLPFPQIPAWFSFTCRDGLRTAHGELIADCARSLSAHSQVAAIGVNCTAPEHVISLIAQIRANTQMPIVVYPNSGQTWDAASRSWLGKASANSWEQRAVEWVKQGATWLGGCCGTTPDDICQIRAALQRNFPAALAHEKSATA